MTSRPRHDPSLAALATVFTLALAVVAHDAAAAGSPGPSRAAQKRVVWALLKAPHPRIDGTKLQRIGPDVQSILTEAITSHVPPDQAGRRALSLIAWFPTQQTWSVALALLEDTRTPTETRRIAVGTLARAFPRRAWPVVERYLSDRDIFLREAAAYAMAHIDHPGAEGRLVDLLDREPEIAVRDAMVAGLAAMRARENGGDSADRGTATPPTRKRGRAGRAGKGR